MPHEIITFQIGHYANYVGTHWWNIQEASFCYDPKATEKLLIDHDVLFREGLNPKGETTFTPRLIAVDLRGSLKSLRQGGTLYESVYSQHNQSALNWSGKIEVFKSEPEISNEFIADLHKKEDAYMISNGYDEDKDICLAPRGSGGSLTTTPVCSRKIYDLTESVKVWSDYLRPHLHPRSIVLVNDFLHNDESNPFNSFANGTEAYKEENLQESIEDRLRRMAEESNQLQGFHILLDSYDGFSGISSEVLNHLSDEYSNKIISAFPLCLPGYNKLDRTSEVLRLVTFLFCLESVSQNSSLFSILGLGNSTFESQQRHRHFPNVNYQPNLPYHSSSLLAMALETFTLPMRTKVEPTSMVDNNKLMTPAGRKCVEMSMCFPFPITRNKRLSEILESKTVINLTPVTPGSGLIGIEAGSVVQKLVLAGIAPERYYPSTVTAAARSPITELLVNRIRSQSSAQMNSVKVMSTPCNLPTTFPNLVERQDYIDDNKAVVLNGCHNTDSSALLFKNILSQLSALNIHKYQHFFSSNMEIDDLTEITETLRSFTEIYDPAIFRV